MTSNVLHPALSAALLIALTIASSGRAAEKADSAAEKAVPAPTSEEIAGWISQLDDSRYLTREQVTRQLLDAGGTALDSLLAAANSARPEPADRAVWIMRRLARSRDNELSIAALERMVQLRGRPLLVERAEAELDERNIAACRARLTPLGAEIVMEAAPFDGISIVPLLSVRLGEKWSGAPADLRAIAQLRRQLYFRLEGKAVDDEVVKFFEEKEKLSLLYLWNVRVSAEAVDSLKARHPDAIVFVRGDALMGVKAENHAGGVLVTYVEPTSGAAAAGIAVGDVIATLDGREIPDFDRLTARIAQHQPGESVEVEIVRGNERRKTSVTLGTRPEGQ